MRPFSIFLPVYNEEEILVSNTQKLLDFLEPLGVEHEILIGSNGSTDRTVELGAQLEKTHSHVRFFHLPMRGPGAALREAIGRMRFEHLVCLDMDLSADLSFVPEALELLSGCDIVIGSKKMGVESRGVLRRWGSDAYIFSSKLLLDLPYDDYSLGAKAYRRAVLERYLDVIDSGTFYVQKIVYLAQRDGLSLRQIPVRCSDFRRSRFHLGAEGFYRFRKLFGLWWQARMMHKSH